LYHKEFSVKFGMVQWQVKLSLRWSFAWPPSFSQNKTQ